MDILNSSENTDGFGWKSAFIGGTSAIGISSIAGTLSNNLILTYYLLQGHSIEQAYTLVSHTINSIFLLILVAIFDITAGLIGGYVSAKFGNGRHLLQGFAVGVLWLMFMFIVFLNPQCKFGSIANMIFSLAIPITSTTLGSYIYAKRT